MSYMPNVNYTITDIYQLASCASLASFRSRAMVYAQSLIDHDASAWIIGNYQTGQASSVFCKGIPRSYAQWFESGVEDALGWKEALSKPGIVYDPTADIPDDRFFQSDFYKFHLANYGIHRLLRFAYLSTGRRNIGVIITLFRFDRENRFTAREKLSFQWIAPHLINAFDLVVEAEFAGESRSDAEQALVDAGGAAYSSTGAYKRYLEEAFGEKSIPQSTIKELAESGHAHVDEYTFSSKQIEDMYLVRIRPAQITDRLSDSERKVAQALSNGATIKMVAKDLGLSPGTVSSYLHRVYKKLGINSKNELIKLRQEF